MTSQHHEQCVEGLCTIQAMLHWPLIRCISSVLYTGQWLKCKQTYRGRFSLSKFQAAQQRPWSDSDLKNTCEQFPTPLGLPKFKSEMRCGPGSELGLNFRDRSTFKPESTQNKDLNLACGRTQFPGANPLYLQSINTDPGMPKKRVMRT